MLDVRKKSILTLKIYKLTSLKYFEVSNRSFLVTLASAWFKIRISILIILLRTVFRRKNDMHFQRRAYKSKADSISLRG